MRESAASITDLILMCAWLMIGYAMLVTSWSQMAASVKEIQQEDKTALVNYTGRADDEFKYTGHDLLLTVVIGDQYEPDEPKMKVESSVDLVIDANSDASPLATNYVNEDRITYISDRWHDQLETYNNQNTITFSRIEDTTGEYIWCVTQ